MDNYYKLIKDKNIYKLTPDEAYGYTSMKLRQQKKVQKLAQIQRTPDHKSIVSQAYVDTVCFKKNLFPTETIRMNDTLKDSIYKLYVAGVLPMRLGGLD